MPPTAGKTPSQGQLDEIISLLKSGAGANSGVQSGVGSERQAKEAVNLANFLNAFETMGHLLADLDPLRLQDHYKDIKTYAKKMHFPSEKMR